MAIFLNSIITTILDSLIPQKNHRPTIYIVSPQSSLSCHSYNPFFIGFWQNHAWIQRQIPPSCHWLPPGPALRGHSRPAARALGRGQAPGSGQGPDLVSDGVNVTGKPGHSMAAWCWWYPVVDVGFISSISLYSKYLYSQWDISPTINMLGWIRGYETNN